MNPQDRSLAHYLSHEDMLRASRLIALASIGDNFVPQDVATKTVRKLLADSDWAKPAVDPIERLKLNGVLVERPAGARFVVAFALDPVAEYLAADEHFERCAGDAGRLTTLRAQVQERGKSAEGFLLALDVTIRWRGAEEARRQRLKPTV